MAQSIAAEIDASVPWIFTQAASASQWTWHTDDFTATILNDSGTWSWELRDADGNLAVRGEASSYETATDLTLEAVGKSMPDEAGYGRWAHRSSRRYRLADGARFDLSEADDKQVRVTLTDGRVLGGRLHLGSWPIILLSETRRLEVHPAHVTKVELA